MGITEQTDAIVVMVSEETSEISVAAEGDTVKKRYRVVRIGVNSVLMEDTESKRQQSLPLTEDLPG